MLGDHSWKGAERRRGNLMPLVSTTPTPLVDITSKEDGIVQKITYTAKEMISYIN
ncbi:hypothetical protein L3i20_v204980 [Paenibacillus sp. L3-i20]|nr:hypothetical protein L3i20_v204980 [Paenibacillus sp. L3-i20]